MTTILAEIVEDRRFSRGGHVIIARYDKDLARGDACFILPSLSTQRLCPLEKTDYDDHGAPMLRIA